jgi:hypothetical protein
MEQGTTPPSGQTRGGPTDSGLPGPGETVFVPSSALVERRAQRWKWALGAVVTLLAVAVMSFLIAWPRFRPRRLDAVEKVAETYLQALVKEDYKEASKLSTIEDPPAIRSVREIAHQKPRDSRLRGSFAPLGEFHSRIEQDYDYDPRAGRFTPKNALGIAAEALDALHEAKEEADKTDVAKMIERGSPDDLFDAAEALSKRYTSIGKLASGVLAPKKIIPTYAMLVDQARPPIKGEAKQLATEVTGSWKDWQTLLGRPFFSLKADGPFSLEKAEVEAVVTDQLASSGDPPTRLRLKLLRFRLEGIDTGWKIVSAKRILTNPEPDDPKADPAHTQNDPPGKSQSSTPQFPDPAPKSR